MNKAILFAFLAFVAVAAAKPRYGVYHATASAGYTDLGNSAPGNAAPAYSAPVTNGGSSAAAAPGYAAPAYSAPVTNDGSPAAAAASASFASSAPGSLLYNVPSYSLGSNYALGGYGNGPSY